MAYGFLSHLADASVRSLVLAILAALLSCRRSAVTRHAIWSATASGMLLLLVLGFALPRVSVRVLNPEPTILTQATPMAQLPEAPMSGTPAPPFSPPAAHTGLRWTEILLAAYAVVTLAFVVRLAAGCLLLHRLLGASQPATPQFRESGRIAIPLTVGWWRPQILLPLSWRDWGTRKLETVLAHETGHVWRRDSLVLFVATLNRCVFWFHPLAWWIERKLAALAEQACDEACLAVHPDRQYYAGLLVEMAAAVNSARGRIYRHAPAMAAPSRLHERIARILDDCRLPPMIARAPWTAVLLAGAPLIYGATAVRFDRAPAVLPLQFPSFRPRAAPLLLAQQQRPPAPVIRPGTTKVTVLVNVVDPFGRFVTGVDASAFHVLEGGAEQTVTEFAGAEPGSLALVYDTPSLVVCKGSFCPAFQPEMPKPALFTVNPDDEFSVARVLRRAAPAPDAAWDQIVRNQMRESLEQLAQRNTPRKAILLLSDGTDNRIYADEDFRTLTREAHVPVYVVLNRPLAQVSNPTAAALLRGLVAFGGAELSVVDDWNQAGRIVTNIAASLSSQYLLSYNAARAGSRGAIEVRLDTPPGLPQLSVKISALYEPR